MASFFGSSAVWLGKQLASHGVISLAASQGQGVLRKQVQDILDTAFSSYNWDPDTSIANGTLINIENCIFRPEFLATLVAPIGFKIVEGQQNTIERARLSIDFSGMFSKPWEMKIEGVHIFVRTLTTEELATAAGGTHGEHISDSTPAQQKPQASGDSFANLTSSGSGNLSRSKASFWEKVFPVANALENLKLDARRLDLHIYDNTDTDHVLQINVENVALRRSSGPPDWREFNASDSAKPRATYKELSVDGVEVSVMQGLYGKGGSTGNTPMCKTLMHAVSLRLLLTKIRAEGTDVNAVADFLKAHYTVGMELTGKSLPALDITSEMQLEYDELSGTWQFNFSGPPMNIIMQHNLGCEELAELQGWVEAISGTFASMQPELGMQLAAAKRSQAVEHARHMAQKARAAELESRCSQLEEMIGHLQGSLLAHQKSSQDQAIKRAEIVSALRSKLKTNLPQSNTDEVKIAKDIDSLILRIAGSAATSEAGNTRQDVGEATADSGSSSASQSRRRGYRFGDLTVSAVRSFKSGGSGTSSGSVAVDPQCVDPSMPQQLGHLVVMKRSCDNAQQRVLTHLNVDHFSNANLWVAIKISGCPELIKFSVGKLNEEADVKIPWPENLAADPQSGEGQKRVELLACWLKLSEMYKVDEQINDKDFTIALQSIKVSASSNDASTAPLIADFSHIFGRTAQVWDGRNAIVVDARGKLQAVPNVTTKNMHTFSKAGKTKHWQAAWDIHPYIYQDKAISNCFNLQGNWVGPGNGCRGGIYRHYRDSLPIEALLSDMI